MTSIFFSACPARGPGSYRENACGLHRFGRQLAHWSVVRAEGFEPPQLSSLEPKSSASTNSATPAKSKLSGGAAAGGGLITCSHLLAAKKRPRVTAAVDARGLDKCAE